MARNRNYGDTTVFTKLRDRIKLRRMSRIARVVVPDLPHHVTQRGNRGERVFLEDGDYALYRDWLAETCRRFGVEVWAYCQMPDHVHLILTPQDGEGLALALGRMPARSPGAPDRPPVSGPVRLGRARRTASDQHGALCRPQSGAGRLAARAWDWPRSTVPPISSGATTGSSACGRSSTAHRVSPTFSSSMPIRTASRRFRAALQDRQASRRCSAAQVFAERPWRRRSEMPLERDAAAAKSARRTCPGSSDPLFRMYHGMIRKRKDSRQIIIPVRPTPRLSA
jgi:Transposase IS200 like